MIDVELGIWKATQRNIRAQKYMMEGKKDPLDDIETILSFSSILATSDIKWLRILQEFAHRNPRKLFSEKQMKILNDIKKKYS